MIRIIEISKGNQTVINTNVINNKERIMNNIPIIGLDPDIEYLVLHEPVPAPSYDNRIYKIIPHYNITTEPHPSLTHLNQYQLTYTLEKLTNDAIKNNLKSRMRQTLDANVSEQRTKEIMLLAIGVMAKHIDRTGMVNKEKAVLDKARDIAVAVFKNLTELANKEQEVDLGTDPDFDTNWDETNIADA